MSRRLVLDPDAEHDLDAIFDAIAADNPVAAQRYIHALRERCDLYMASPWRGQARELPLAHSPLFLCRNGRGGVCSGI